jgi:hypothetical protein
MPECKFCKEVELEWFTEESTGRWKLGRKIDENTYNPHNCKKFNKKPKKEVKPYPYRYVSALCVNMCKKHDIMLTELNRCLKCGLDSYCIYNIIETKPLKHPFRFRYVNGKEERDYDITIKDVMANNLTIY